MYQIVWKANTYPPGTAAIIVCPEQLLDYVNNLWLKNKGITPISIQDFEDCWLDPNIPVCDTKAYQITIIDDLQNRYSFYFKPESYSAILDCFRRKRVAEEIMMVPFPSYLIVLPTFVGESLETQLKNSSTELLAKEQSVKEVVRDKLKTMVFRSNKTPQA